MHSRALREPSSQKNLMLAFTLLSKRLSFAEQPVQFAAKF